MRLLYAHHQKIGDVELASGIFLMLEPNCGQEVFLWELYLYSRSVFDSINNNIVQNI